MERGLQGEYRTISTKDELVRAFIPAPLPPVPSIDWSAELRGKFDQALLSLGRLDSISTFLPEASIFLYMCVRKEAVLSSMIEGTQSSLSDLLLFEMDQVPGVPLDDVREVSNYVAALDFGMKQLSDGFPLSLRLMKGIHRILLKDGRGKHGTPGEFRRSQNWIGGTRPGNAVFVPPPVDLVNPCLYAFEDFLHDKPGYTPPLLKAALAHVQFETIHPFLDGNGRLGRLLITLMLCEQKILQKPVLYLSLYLKANRKRYYELLNDVRLTGDWEAWLSFFCEAVIKTSDQAVDTAKRLFMLTDQDREKLHGFGRATASMLKVHQALVERPLITSAALVKKIGIMPNTVNKALSELTSLGILKEITGKKRNRIYSYWKYIDILNEGTELP